VETPNFLSGRGWLWGFSGVS